MGEVTILYRPVGEKEPVLIRESGFTTFPEYHAEELAEANQYTENK